MSARALFLLPLLTTALLSQPEGWRKERTELLELALPAAATLEETPTRWLLIRLPDRGILGPARLEIAARFPRADRSADDLVEEAFARLGEAERLSRTVPAKGARDLEAVLLPSRERVRLVVRPAARRGPVLVASARTWGPLHEELIRERVLERILESVAWRAPAETAPSARVRILAGTGLNPLRLLGQHPDPQRQIHALLPDGSYVSPLPGEPLHSFDAQRLRRERVATSGTWHREADRLVLRPYREGTQPRQLRPREGGGLTDAEGRTHLLAPAPTAPQLWGRWRSREIRDVVGLGRPGEIGTTSPTGGPPLGVVITPLELLTLLPDGRFERRRSYRHVPREDLPHDAPPGEDEQTAGGWRLRGHELSLFGDGGRFSRATVYRWPQGAGAVLGFEQLTLHRKERYTR